MGDRGIVSRAKRRTLATLGGVAGWTIARDLARAAGPDDEAGAGWPARPIRLIASVAAGSSLDALARLTATRLATELGQNVVVENRPGASGNIAAEAVARAAPDGYALLFTSNSITTLPALIGERAVDPLVALSPVSIVAAQPMVIVAHPSFSGATFGDLVDAARRAPRPLAYATSGVGTFAHLTALWLQSLAGFEMLHVPYSGAASFRDVVSGEVPFAFGFAGSALPLVREGQLKGIAVTSAQRMDVAPSIPTVSEGGVAGFESLNWQGVLAPAGTPPAIVRKLHEALERVGRDAGFDAKLRSMGFTPVFGTPDAFASEIRRETQRWSKVVASAGLATR